MLIPFYIFPHEKPLKVYNNEQKLKEIARKYENIQKGVGGMMRGPMIETSARRLKDKAENEAKREVALRMLEDGELPIEKVARYSGLAVKEVEELAKLQTV